MIEFHRAGVDEFILSGYPHLELALRFGEEVAPRVRRKLDIRRTAMLSQRRGYRPAADPDPAVARTRGLGVTRPR